MRKIKRRKATIIPYLVIFVLIALLHFRKDYQLDYNFATLGFLTFYIASVVITIRGHFYAYLIFDNETIIIRRALGSKKILLSNLKEIKLGNDGIGVFVLYQGRTVDFALSSLSEVDISFLTLMSKKFSPTSAEVTSVDP